MIWIAILNLVKDCGYSRLYFCRCRCPLLSKIDVLMFFRDKVQSSKFKFQTPTLGSAPIGPARTKDDMETTEP